MSPVTYVSARDTLKVTVNDFVKDPLLLPTRIVTVLSDQFISEKILRPGGKPPGSTIKYYESPPLYADDDFELVNDGAEIPVARTQRPEPKYERVRRRGLAVVIDWTMRDENDMDELNRQIRLVRNTAVKTVDGTFMTAIRANVPTIAATTPWDDPASAIRRNINAAKQEIVDERRNFNPNILGIHPTQVTNILNSDEFTAPYVGDIAGDNPLITGELPGTILGLKPFSSYQFDPDEALIAERGTLGAYFDKRPLRATELYEDKPREVFRSDVTRITGVALDEPRAARRITGLQT